MQGVYFALRRRGLDAQEASRKNVSLVFSLHGQKQGKTELFTAADLRKTQENQGLSVIRMDKPEFVYLSLCLFVDLHRRYNCINDNTNYNRPKGQFFHDLI